MLSNNQMYKGCFLRWHQARRKVAAIIKHLEAGHEVHICTYTKATRYTKKHASMFKAGKTGAFVQHGKSWVCFDGCKIEVYE